MKPQEFIDKYMPFAEVIEFETTIPAIAIVAQAAFESGWGTKAIGNNLFGIKYRQGDWGLKKVQTVEYFTNRKDFAKIPSEDIMSVEYQIEKRKFRVVARLKFADYATPLEAFKAHAKLLLTDRYKGALEFKDDPKMYLRKIAESGYATDTNYAVKMSAMVNSVLKRL